jgi:7-cyano-7-deazaguanine synthase
MSSVVVLLSGGVDSATLAYIAAAGKRLHSCVFVDFAQPAVEAERRAALLVGEALGVEVVEAQVNLIGDHMRTGAGAAGPRMLPGRNLALIARAVNHAAANGAAEVWFGAIRDDYADYPDCRPEFERAVSTVTRMAYGVTVRAPLLGCTKREVLLLAGQHGVPLALTWSCYEPAAGKPCGTCNSCRSREAA